MRRQMEDKESYGNDTGKKEYDGKACALRGGKRQMAEGRKEGREEMRMKETYDEKKRSENLQEKDVRLYD